MIFYWLRRAWVWYLKLWLKPPLSELARINENRKCPVCGARQGRLRCIKREIVGSNGHNSIEVLCEHRCSVCGARFYEKPVMKIDDSYVHPALARDAIEIAEDNEIAAERQRLIDEKPSLGVIQ